jgi:signal transduction histidine kinase
MTAAGPPSPGLSYSRLVPSTLLPPEDPSRPGPRRTVRDWVVDILLILAALALGVLFFAATVDAETPSAPHWLQGVDACGGVLACTALWWRRRWPLGVAVLTVLLSVVSAAAAPASVISLFTVAVHRRTTVTAAVIAINLAASAVFTVIRPQAQPFWIAMVISVVIVAVVTAWGLFVRARRQLVWTLRERAERAETEQRMLADQARLAERTRIAREMHDVLAHRISLMALHAGGLQVRPDLPADQVQKTAALLRSTAQQALEELRGVIGVLREETSDDGTAPAPAPPQPTLSDIPRLVEETRRAGARITFAMDVPAGAEPPASLGRDAFRIVQEALTNVTKHAGGTATSVRVDGAPGAGLHVQVRNRLPVAATASALPGSGSGLLGLRERVTLSGGTLEHGPSDAGEFVVEARLPW